MNNRIASSVCSLGLVFGVWELSYLLGFYSETVMPPPHVLLWNLPAQAVHFDFGSRIAGEAVASNSTLAVLTTTGATIARVCAGLALGFVLGVLTGLAIRYYRFFGNIVLPTLTLLAPISPFAWLPVAVFMFGVGDVPAVFLVFIAVYFIIVIATIAEVDSVSVTFLNVARIMGASRRQIYLEVILPSALPGLFLMLRVNLFVAWMVVLIAESAGTSAGLGAVIMLARNTANDELVFFGFIVIGVVGFLFDLTLRIVQQRLLYWRQTDVGVATA